MARIPKEAPQAFAVPPEAFGADGATWAAPPQSDAEIAAAAWYQHRLMKQLVAVGATRSSIAEATGRSVDQADNYLSGASWLELSNLLALGMYFGFENFPPMPTSIHELLPPDLHTRIVDWQLGEGSRLELQPPDPRLVDWLDVLEGALGVLAQPDDASRLATPEWLIQETVVPLAARAVGMSNTATDQPRSTAVGPVRVPLLVGPDSAIGIWMRLLHATRSGVVDEMHYAFDAALRDVLEAALTDVGARLVVVLLPAATWPTLLSRWRISSLSLDSPQTIGFAAWDEISRNARPPIGNALGDADVSLVERFELDDYVGVVLEVGKLRPIA